MQSTTSTAESMNAKGDRAAADIRDGIRRVQDDVRQTASSVRDNLEGVAHEAGQYVRQAAHSAEQSIGERVSDNPIQSILIALGVGAFLGVLLRR
jgi:ElaB/YqjD/DUF883 family membrane-anchored ribosome-binding protein